MTRELPWQGPFHCSDCVNQNATVPLADKRGKKDKHKVGQKRQQKANKDSDADTDASSEEDGYLDSKEMDYLSDSASSSDGETS